MPNRQTRLWLADGLGTEVRRVIFCWHRIALSRNPSSAALKPTPQIQKNRLGSVVLTGPDNNLLEIVWIQYFNNLFLTFTWKMSLDMRRWEEGSGTGFDTLIPPLFAISSKISYYPLLPLSKRCRNVTVTLFAVLWVLATGNWQFDWSWEAITIILSTWKCDLS